MNNKFSLLILVIITTAIYFKSLNNKFTIWDDDSYITENPNIRTLHGDSISYTLEKTFKSYVVGNYHPLTMLSYCFEYQKFKLNPKPYHITNFVLHLLNTLLVFAFIWLLTKQQWTAFFTSLLFAIHPMHVESVSWIAERKDVLYAFFYLTALCTYILYSKSEKWKGYLYVLTFFIFCLAVLSKAMAVSIPLAFMAIDYFFGRKIGFKTVLEKIPFLLLSFVIGYIAIEAQKLSGALEGIIYYSFFDRVLFISYGIVMYLWKLLLPIDLSCFYNYPPKQNGWYPILFYIAPFIIVGLLFLIYKSKNYGKDIFFGFAFFFITILLVIQILPVGGALMADRYTYLPYIGLFFIIARWINVLIENRSKKYFLLQMILLAFCITALSFLSFNRTKVWHNSISLWSDAIQKNEMEDVLYKSRGVAYTKAKLYDQAIKDFNRAIEIRPKNPDVFYDRGFVYSEKGEYLKAINDYSGSLYYLDLISTDSSMAKRYLLKYEKAYNNRGVAYTKVGKINEAITDFTAAIKKDSTFADAYNNRGMAYRDIRKFNEAIRDFKSAIRHFPKFENAYSNLGIINYKSFRKYKEAIANFDSAIRIDSTNAIAYYHRGFSHYYLGDFNDAVKDYTSAIHADPGFVQAYFNRGIAYFSLKQYENSANDYSVVINSSPNYGMAYYNRALAFEAIGRFKEALEDVQEANRLMQNVDPSYIKLLEAKAKN